jgi:mono/diheme cytochrome c family protein
MRLRLRALAAAAALSGGVALAAVAWWRGHATGPVQRGARLAASSGCLACHGPAGQLADPDGARHLGSVPSFGHDDVTGYARSVDEIRQWILDGRPRRLADERAEDPPPLLRMPAWRGRLSGAEVEDLVAYVRAVSDFDPVAEGPAAKGREIAAALGCFACHGPQGLSDTPNPGSLKGYIPSWSGTDFPELARDDGEIREWIRDGGPRRLREHPVAAFFLRRQAIRMPAYGERVTEAETAAVTAYIRWLRRSGGSPPTP